jgi:hypothetical protein
VLPALPVTHYVFKFDASVMPHHVKIAAF